MIGKGQASWGIRCGWGLSGICQSGYCESQHKTER